LRRALLPLAACLLLCLSLPSCAGGPKLIKVAGKLTYGQKPLPAGRSSPVIVFHPVVAKGEHHDTYPALYQRDSGAYEVPGKTGAGIPEGKYRISVQFLLPKASSLQEKWNQQFSPEKSSIVREVTGAGQLDIDLASPKG
jgi:hypothetical protein